MLQANHSQPSMTQDKKAMVEAGQAQIADCPSSEDVSIDEHSDHESTSSQEAEDERAAEADLQPYIFCSEGRLPSATQGHFCSECIKFPDVVEGGSIQFLFVHAETPRAFIVEQIIRAQASHRPAFTFKGYAVERQNGSQTERGSASGDLSHRQRGSQSARGGMTHRSRLSVFARDLTLDIAYEPPSPKFRIQAPGSSSYRLKLSKHTTGFLYSVRGLPMQLIVHRKKNIVQWGPLELWFSSKFQMQRFVENVKHVELLEYNSAPQPLDESAIRDSQPKPTTLSVPANKPADQQSSFGSPLPSPLPSPEKPQAQSGPAVDMLQAAGQEHITEQASASKGSPYDHNFPGPAETIAGFLNDNWAWIGIGVAAVSLVTFVTFRSSSASAASSVSKAHQYQLHLI